MRTIGTDSAGPMWARKPKGGSWGTVADIWWSGRWDSNPRPSAWEADTLPLSYTRMFWLRRSWSKSFKIAYFPSTKRVGFRYLILFACLIIHP